ncbi:MAG: uracil-DNA glycosylase [Candidatus Brocadiae bacterium]|nr:uracil-DNA glycosylase [Candidatus Brocadiia bacterium]
MKQIQKSISALQQEIQKHAQLEAFSIDKEVYLACGKDPISPILMAGSLESPLCFFARDLGRDEVRAGQPLYGAAGRMVRSGIYNSLYNSAASSPQDLDKAASYVLLTNTVPYKPIDNKAYPPKVRERFRPFILSLLMDYWQGKYIIPLGTEALQWFEKYDTSPKFKAFIKSESRFVETFELQLTSSNPEESKKNVLLCPLPHPSPLNQKYYALFPQMLNARLEFLKKDLEKFTTCAG